MVLYVLYAFTAPIAVKRIPKIAIGGNIEPAIIVQKIPKQTTKIPMSIAARGDWGSLLLLFLRMENTSLKAFLCFGRVYPSSVKTFGFATFPSGKAF